MVHLDIDGDRARAVVEAPPGSVQRVGINWRLVVPKRALHAFCECKQFAEGSACAHLWATLLAAGASGPENQPPGKDRVGLRRDRASAWNELEDKDHPLAVHTVTRKPAKNRARRKKRGPKGTKGTVDLWRSQLDDLRAAAEASVIAPKAKKPGAEREVDRFRFLINSSLSDPENGIVFDIFATRPGSTESSPKLQRVGIDPRDLSTVLAELQPDDDTSTPPSMITVMPPEAGGRGGRARLGRRPARRQDQIRRFRIPPEAVESLVPALGKKGLLGWWEGRPRAIRQLVTWDDQGAWQLALRLETGARSARIEGRFVREGDAQHLTEATLVLPPFVLFNNVLAPLKLSSPLEEAWIQVLGESGDIVVPDEDLGEAFTSLVEIPGLPRIDGPQEFQITKESSEFRPRLVLESDVLPNAPLLASQSFVYGALDVSAEDPNPAVIDWKQQHYVQRDLDGEHQALLRLLEAGAQPMPAGGDHALQVAHVDLPSVVEPLLAEGWEVEVRGTSLSLPGTPAMRVENKTDWFEISGDTEFKGNRVELKQILEAVSSGDRFIDLGDGTKGLLPASWMDNFESLSKLAHESEDDEGKLRFLPSQALLVDVLLNAMPPADVDGSFTRLREKLGSFESIKPKKEPRGFKGTLRTYQREGLAWLTFLREFGLGGVLADDMGLGKTVQVLALIKGYRTKTKTTGLPTLVLAPRSLVYNWIDEAANFTPSLKVVEYRGPGRDALREKFSDFDIIVTTYGTLRRDIDYLSTVEFDTLVLDEAQAIKNRDSLSAKACRLLRARNRLALTGTPIENHLGELGSIFEILNPGLLGSLPKLEVLGSSRTASEQELKLVADGIRPFILRRTKAEVLKDLPPKTEQILYCSLHEKQQEIYDKLRLAYQGTLLGEIEDSKKKGSAIQVLEALLRLRQVACHPGLVDEEWNEAGSAKLDALFAQVEEILDEGHKIIVFSQFTKLLAYVRKAFDEKDANYAYLDGQTGDRGAVVERFQNDPDCNLFLVSLKAGGLGLNLTAASYVFLLDPWWNPAVEAQAIDRAHRIGQTQPIFAYRMIARGTVEEKILDLQVEKRKLVEAVLGGEEQSMPSLTADDLRTLLS